MARRRRTGGPNGASQNGRSIRFGGREWPVIDRMTIGRRTYLILERLGHAGRQRYLAFDPHAGPGGDLRALLVLPQAPEAFRHVRILKSRSSDSFPRILEYRQQGEELLLVLNWIQGKDLQSYLDEVRRGSRPQPSATEALRLGRGLAHGVSQLHRWGATVHGDIKPANLILAPPPSSRLVLVDFGSAWTAEKTIGREEGDGISAAYSAPELQQGAAFVDHRADQFSVSVVLYELLTLALPYDGLGGKAGRPEFASRMRDKLVPPSEVSPDRGKLPRHIWNSIDRLLHTGLQFEPDGRYPTPSAWLDEIDAVHAEIQFQSRTSQRSSRLTRVIAWLAEKMSRQ